jgi:RNA polymerase sigma-70 factor, ECF subfamily
MYKFESDDDPSWYVRADLDSVVEGPPRASQTTANDPDTFRDLLDAARAGDREASGRLLERSRSKLLRVVRKRIEAGWVSKAGGSDVVQDAFLKAYVGLERFRGECESELEVWLRLILESCLRDTARAYRTGKRSCRREVSVNSNEGAFESASRLIDRSETPDEAERRSEEAHRLRAAIAELPASQRMILTWHAMEDCTFAEIGWRLGCSTTTAHKRWLAALEAVKRGPSPTQTAPRLP